MEARAECERCGAPVAVREAWILVQSGARSMLCASCAADVGPALTGPWSTATELNPPPEKGAEDAPPASPSPTVGDELHELEESPGRHPVLWFVQSMLVLALALAPFVFFFWLTTR
ncbi:MAG TPA: hypothetical protein VLJ44_04440 [Gaiellaceae bacterium]|nr:hypothetical protein [Gaiellaceae bacterium]